MIRYGLADLARERADQASFHVASEKFLRIAFMRFTVDDELGPLEWPGDVVATCVDGEFLFGSDTASAGPLTQVIVPAGEVLRVRCLSSRGALQIIWAPPFGEIEPVGGEKSAVDDRATTLTALLAMVATRPGVAESDLRAVEEQIGRLLPDDYKDVLRLSNGLEGFVAPDVYLMLYAAQEIAALNGAYGTEESVPGVTLIGSDGGDTGYGYEWSDGKVRYVTVPLVGMARDALSDLGGSFAEFLARIRADRGG